MIQNAQDLCKTLSLVLQAALALLLIKAGLAVFPLRRVRYVLAVLGRRRAAGSDRTPQLVVWAVKKVAALAPGTCTCLPRALAAQLLLARRGYPAELEIGFVRTAAGLIEGHAWLRRDGDVLIGGDIDLTHFTPLPSLTSRRTTG